MRSDRVIPACELRVVMESVEPRPEGCTPVGQPVIAPGFPEIGSWSQCGHAIPRIAVRPKLRLIARDLNAVVGREVVTRLPRMESGAEAGEQLIGRDAHGAAAGE